MTQESDARHVPVMAPRITELLSVPLSNPASVLLDCTLGLGGHAAALLAANPAARLIGIDRDADALRIAGDRLAAFAERITLVQAVFDELADVLRAGAAPRVQAILMDLGLSSLQIDATDRGFSYARDAPLDMRMDARAERTAADVVNSATEAELVHILRAYGDEPAARPLARAIVTDRQIEPFNSSARLVDLIGRVARRPGQARSGHPAKRAFQALRIEVNGELAALDSALPQAIDALAPGGRLAVLAYHSGEDRLVKQTFRAATEIDVPRGLPVPADQLRPRLRLLTRGAERPGESEIAANPRAASARLRAVENLEEAA